MSPQVEKRWISGFIGISKEYLWRIIGGAKELGTGTGKGRAVGTTQLKSWHELTVGETPALEGKTAVALADHRSATQIKILKLYLDKLQFRLCTVSTFVMLSY